MDYLGIALKTRARMEAQGETPHDLIDRTLEKINQEWRPGALGWMKRSRPGDWTRMVALEGEINKMALEGNLEGLRGALGEYQSLILAMVRAFRTPRGEMGNLFNHADYKNQRRLLR